MKLKSRQPRNKKSLLNSLKSKTVINLIVILLMEVLLLSLIVRPAINFYVVNYKFDFIDNITNEIINDGFNVDLVESYDHLLASDGILFQVFDKESSDNLYSINSGLGMGVDQRDYVDELVDISHEGETNKISIHSGSELDEHLTGLTGRRNQFSFVADAGDVVLIMQIPYGQIEGIIDITEISIMLVTVVAAIIAVILARLSYDDTVKVLNEIKRIIKEVSINNFDVKYSILTFDEYDELGEDLNLMVENLGDYSESMRETNLVLQASIEERKKIDQLLTDFIADASHEIRTPLSIISGYSQALKDDIVMSKEDRQEFLEVIIEETKGMNHIFNQLLELSQQENRSTLLNKREADLTKLLNLVESKYKNTTRNKVTTDFNHTSNVYIDTNAVSQVITNYINNALKYSEKGTDITITTTERPDDIIVSVGNKGSNIKDEEKDRIWNKFYRIDPSHTKDDEKDFSSGIGLSIVKASMIAHESKYGYSNTPDGVKFYVILDKNKQ